MRRGEEEEEEEDGAPLLLPPPPFPPAPPSATVLLDSTGCDTGRADAALSTCPLSQKKPARDCFRRPNGLVVICTMNEYTCGTVWCGAVWCGTGKAYIRYALMYVHTIPKGFVYRTYINGST